jgi:hypothetical protein
MEAGLKGGGCTQTRAPSRSYGEIRFRFSGCGERYSPQAMRCCAFGSSASTSIPLTINHRQKKGPLAGAGSSMGLKLKRER